MKRFSIWLAPAALAAVLATPAVSLAQTQPFHVVHRFTIGGEGGWDYLVSDPASARLFLSRSTHVMVIDEVTGRLLGDIPNTPGVHGVALVPGRNRGFTSNGRDSSVTMFDLTSLAPLGTYRVSGQNPDAILYDSVSDRVFTFNGRSANATALDAGTGAVLGTVALDGKPETGVADGTGHVYVNIEDKSELTLFDARTLAVQHTWPVTPCEEPTGLQMDRSTQRLFVGCGGNAMLAVVDAKSGRVVTTVPTGSGVDGVAFDPLTKLIYVPAGEGNMTVVREVSADEYETVATVTTMPGARTVGLDPVRHEAYTVSAEREAAAAAQGNQPRRRPRYKADSFTVMAIGATAGGR